MLNRLLGTLSLCSLAFISACGGGGGGTSGDSAGPAPVELGAALPTEGDYIAFTSQQLSLSEASRTGSVTVVRSGNAMGASSVKYRFVSGTATAGADFRGADGVLNWGSGDSAARTVRFLIESDTVAESSEDFRIELFDAVGQNVLGINDSVSVSVDDSLCNATIPASITSDTKLSAPCYQLDGLVQVSSTAQLHIDAGTAIVASPDSGFIFSDGATLNAEGFPSLPVIVKGASDQSGQWHGFNLKSSSPLHRISYTEIANATDAIKLTQGGFAQFDNNTLADNSAAGVVLPMADAHALGANNLFINTPRGIELSGTSIDVGQSVMLPIQSTHYVLASGLVVKGTLSLAAGVDMRIAADVPVIVLSTGAINAVGTVEQPISITGLEPTQGFWNGIQYVSSSRTDNRFEFATISHGGGDPARAGNIIVDGLDTQIALTQCAITHSAGFGIKYDSSAFQVELQEVTFAVNTLGEQSL